MGVHGQVEAAIEAAGELLGAGAHLAGAAVHVQRQADDDGIGFPFGDQFFHLGPVRHAVLRLEGAQLTGLPGDHLANGHANLFAAVVEAQQQAQFGHQACPAWLVKRLRLMPRLAAAAPRRWSLARPKMISGSNGQLSQALSASSASSCPASQPA
ncbi:hypothetical protein D3C79_913010 [compost metagenome]